MREISLKRCRQWANLPEHHNVVRFLGVYYKPSTARLTSLPVLVMEEMDMSLTNFLERPSKISDHTKLSILLDVAQGLKHLHSLKTPIEHGNLSSNNILLFTTSTGLQAKISDVSHINQTLRTVMQTKADWPFLPPECLLESQSAKHVHVDIFSYGVVMLHVDAHRLPELKQGYESRKQAPKQRCGSRYQNCIDQMTLELKRLASTCLETKAEKRPTIDRILKEIEPMAYHTLKTEYGSHLQEVNVIIIHHSYNC